jgi:hypothetical protein
VSFNEETDVKGRIDDPERIRAQDKKDFALYYKDFKKILKLKHLEKEPLNRRRDWHSFDGDLLREPYDIEVERESHFDSEISRDSFPLP